MRIDEESFRCKAYWHNVFGKKFRHPGNTRWWATYELFDFMRSNFAELENFIMHAVEDGDMPDNGARINRLQAVFESRKDKAILKLELDIIVIFCYKLVTATYILEGDGPLAITAYDTLQHIRAYFNLLMPTLSFPGLQTGEYIYEYI